MRSRTIGGLAGAAAAALVAVSLMATPATTQTDATPEDTVTVTAAGKVEGRPDLASVTFGISAQAETAEGAMEELARRQNAVIDALLALGLPEEDVTTGGVDLDKDCHYDRNLERTVCEGFVARTSVRAETRDLESIGEIIDTGVRAGANNIRGVTFERTEQNEAIKEALAQAMDLAKTKAEVLAVRAGRQLGRAIIIEEGGALRPVRRTVAVYGTTAARSADAGSTIRINPADEITKVSIVVTFALN